VSRNFLEVTHGSCVQIEIQVKDEEDNWQTITYPYQRYCGTGLYSHPIFPDDIVITSIPVFKGNYKTKARIKIFDYYSDEFQIGINNSIFISPNKSQVVDTNDK